MQRRAVIWAALVCLMSAMAGSLLTSGPATAIGAYPSSFVRTSTGDYFLALSCGSATDCVTPGFDGAYAFDGTQWSRVLYRVHYRTVSCTGAGVCMLVADGTRGSRLRRTATGAWGPLTPLAVPAGTIHRHIQTRRVSCVSASFCMLVGSHQVSRRGNNTALAERWNGRKWQALRMPAIASVGPSSELDSVSCWAVNRCLATGEAITDGSGDFRGVAAWWNGTRWHVTSLPGPRGTLGNSIGSSVSCLSASFCMASGPYYTRASDPIHGFAGAVWNGKRWAVHIDTSPSERHFDMMDGGGDFNGTSCASTHFCITVGTYSYDSEQRQRAFAAFWNGHSWRPLAISLPRSWSQQMATAISCPARQTCYALTQAETPASGTVGAVYHLT